MSPLSVDDTNIVLQNKLKGKSFELVSCKERSTSDVPTGFLSLTEKLCIKYKTDGQEEELHVFIKKVPASTYHRNMVTSNGAFRKEVLLFDKFLNELIDKVDGNPIPTCYLGRPDDVLVLKDLSHEGFSNVPLLKTFSVDHCSKALESLAKLHAASLIFETKQGCKISEHIPLLLEETVFTDDDNHISRKAVMVGFKALRRLRSKYLPHYDDELTEKVFKFLFNLHEKMKPSTKYPNVISHSDLWANNIMFRYNSEGKVAEACIIDFQLAGYRPLMYDVLMLLYACTDQQLRGMHQSHLLEHYYSSLSKEMESEGTQLSKLLPHSEFETMYRDFRPVILGIVPQFLHFVLMPDEIVKDVLQNEEKWINYYERDRSDFALKAAAECLPYRSRVVGALQELFEYFETSKSS